MQNLIKTHCWDRSLLLSAGIGKSSCSICKCEYSIWCIPSEKMHKPGGANCGPNKIYNTLWIIIHPSICNWETKFYNFFFQNKLALNKKKGGKGTSFAFFFCWRWLSQIYFLILEIDFRQLEFGQLLFIHTRHTPWGNVASFNSRLNQMFLLTYFSLWQLTLQLPHISVV